MLYRRFPLALALCLLTIIPAMADHHKGHHHHGPNGGALVALDDSGLHVEMVILDGETVTARVFNSQHKHIAIDAAKITLTFTEPDGEKEDYTIAVKKTDEAGSVFQKKDDHIVHHIMRDKMSIKVKAGGKEPTSATFSYPHGPHGGEVVALGESGLHAELVARGELVHVHILNKRKRPAQVDASEITLTFTESDGEKEDYKIALKEGKSKGTIFERKSAHVVKHVTRDKTSVKLTVDGKTHESKTISYAKH